MTFEPGASVALVALVMNLERKPWSARSLHRALFSHPWMTAKGIGAIHWEALRLYLKKVSVFTHPRNLTTTTISQQQYEYAHELFGIADPDRCISLLLKDYRELNGRFDKIVSIEMFEAVGFEHYDEFFRACDRLLEPDSSMFVQTITMNEHRFPQDVKQSDWIRKYIFPGAELASLRGVLDSLARATRLSLFHAEDLGVQYARPLAAWRERFLNSIAEVEAVGFDDRFIRMWNYYLAFYEGALLERHIGDFRLLLTKNYDPRSLFQKPWRPTLEAERQETLL